MVKKRPSGRSGRSGRPGRSGRSGRPGRSGHSGRSGRSGPIRRARFEHNMCRETRFGPDLARFAVVHSWQVRGPRSRGGLPAPLPNKVLGTQ